MPSPFANIPKPTLRTVENLTPFVHFIGEKMAPGRRFLDLLIVKGTFELVPGRVTLASDYEPIHLSDEPFEPSRGMRSSLFRAGDLHLPKAGGDLFVTGVAHSPSGRPEASWETGVALSRGGDRLVASSLVAHGYRRFEHRALRGWTLGDTEPADSIPIAYELAYGGAYPARDPPESDPGLLEVYEPNPCGRGFVDERTLDKSKPILAPRWEVVGSPVKAINTDSPLAGYGPLARTFAARQRWAGTYDDAWFEQARRDHAAGLPSDYPEDLDPRFFNVAPPSLMAPRPFDGDEQLALTGLVQGHPRFTTSLPGLRLEANLRRFKGGWETELMPLDTIHVDLDARRLHLTWRLALDHRRHVRAAVVTTKEAS